MSKPKLYLSLDIEADGNNVLVNNMISIGIYGIDRNGHEILTFQVNLEDMNGHIPDRQCMEEFWSKNPVAWAKTQENKQQIIPTFKHLSQILTELNKDWLMVFVAMPSCFDWMFFKSYYEFAKCIDKTIKFDIGFKCTCLSTLLAIYRKQNNLSSKDFETFKETLISCDPFLEHDALYDAKIQGLRYLKLIKLMNLI